VYFTYSEVFSSLGNQGFLGFYKGNLIGLSHFWLSSFIKLNIFDILDQRRYYGLDIQKEKIKFALSEDI
jgi:hypothetical protein